MLNAEVARWTNIYTGNPYGSTQAVKLIAAVMNFTGAIAAEDFLFREYPFC